MNISEHTGHGIPVIVNKYGQDAFEIRDNYINVVITFNKEIMAVDGNSDIENYVITKVLKNNKISANTISKQLDVGHVV